MTRKPSEQVDFREVGRRVFQLVNISYPTLKDFLERSGINRAMLYRMRNDGNPLRVQDLVDISAYLGVSLDYLLGLETPEGEAADACLKTLMNIWAYRDQWTKEERYFLACVAVGLLTEEQEEEIRVRLGLMDPETGSNINMKGASPNEGNLV